MVAYQFRMPAGIPGTISRAAEQSSVEPAVITPAGQANAPTSYGVGTVIDAVTGQLRLPVAADAAVTGILVRPFPTNSSQDPLGTSTPPAKGPVDRLKRGYATVTLSGPAQPVKDGPVFCRIQNPAAGKFIGGFEAAPDGANTVPVAASYFTGPPDASGNVEVAFNI